MKESYLTKCSECQFEKSKHGIYEYTPHAPGCSKAGGGPHTEEWVKDFDDLFNDSLPGKDGWGKANQIKIFIKVRIAQALEQGRKEGREGALREARQIIGGEVSWLTDTYNYEDQEIKESAQVEILQKVDEKIAALSKLREV